MESLTKFQIGAETVRELFLAGGVGGLTQIKPLTAGEFNGAFYAAAGNAEYVIKIAPRAGTAVLTYEQGMMKHEMDTYELMRGKTQMKFPRVVFSDFSRERIPAEYFIMEFIGARVLSAVKPDKALRVRINERLAVFLSELHRVKGTGFGYPQNGLHSDWYRAFKAMVQNLIADAGRKYKKLKGAGELLGYIERYRDVLSKVEPSLVNFDLWDLNIFYAETDGDFTLTVIDPERSFFGDPMGDFVALDFLKPIEKKQYLWDAYNQSASAAVCPDREGRLRYYMLCVYLSLIMQCEKYYRYKKSQLKYWSHSLAARLFRRHGLKNLGKLSKDAR